MERHPRRLGGLSIGQGMPRAANLWPDTPRDTLPSFEVTFACNGRSFIAVVRARNSLFALHEAEIELASKCPDFDHENARAVACKQVMA